MGQLNRWASLRNRLGIIVRVDENSHFAAKEGHEGFIVI